MTEPGSEMQEIADIEKYCTEGVMPSLDEMKLKCLWSNDTIES